MLLNISDLVADLDNPKLEIANAKKVVVSSFLNSLFSVPMFFLKRGLFITGGHVL